MTTPSTNAASAEVTVIDTQARWPLLLMLGSALAWLVVSGVFALISAVQLHSPAFFSECAWFTHGRMKALHETAFVYGWAANAGLAISLWILGRLGGHPLRALNWVVVGAVFWNFGVVAGLVGIATGDMTSFTLLQLPRYVQPLMVFAYAAMAISGVLAWSGRQRAGTFASQWYAVAALFLLPWLLTAAQVVLLWSPLRGVVQSIGASWFAQGVVSLWLVPLALAGAYYVVPKVAGRALPGYEAAPLGFWTLILVGSWTGGRHLIGGPVPAWVPTVAVVGAVLLLFHYVVVALNLRVVIGADGTAIRFVSFGLVAYLLSGLLEIVSSFRSAALHTQFTFFATAVDQVMLYGAVSMLFFGAIYYMVPRLTGRVWASGALTAGHMVTVMTGVVASVVALLIAGSTQSELLLKPAVTFAGIFGQVRFALLINTAAQFVLITASLLVLVNFVRTACVWGAETPVAAPELLRRPAALEGSAS
jgi:cytochrome c oxidase cbb3-type subunit 1